MSIARLLCDGRWRVTAHSTDGGHFNHRRDHDVGNEFVVPHNTWLCTLLDCHINIEITVTVGCVKYIYK